MTKNRETHGRTVRVGRSANVFLGLSFYRFFLCVCVVMYNDEFDIMENKILNMEKFKPRHVLL